MCANEGAKFKKELKVTLTSIKTLKTLIQTREQNLCNFEGEKLKKKEKQLANLQKSKAEKTEELTKLKNRISTMWNA